MSEHIRRAQEKIQRVIEQLSQKDLAKKLDREEERYLGALVYLRDAEVHLREAGLLIEKLTKERDELRESQACK